MNKNLDRSAPLRADSHAARRFALAFAAAVTLDALATAQVELYRFTGGEVWCVGPAGDVDLDGVPDVALGGVSGASASQLDLVVASGRDGSELRRFIGVYPTLAWEAPLMALDDLDGDGAVDLLVSIGAALAPNQSAHVRVLSSSSGSVLLDVFGASPFPAERFGAALAVLDDLDADGRRDFAVGAPRTFGASPGAVLVYSSATGQVLWQRNGAGAFAPRFGHALARCGDIDFDGMRDLAVGDQSNLGFGRVAMLSGRDGQELWSASGTIAGGDFGWSLAEVGDFDSDGIDDLAVGAPALNAYLQGLLVVRDHVFVLSGATGAVLRDVTGPAGTLLLGMDVARLGDVDVDGIEDLAVRTMFDGGVIPSGELHVYSGSSGALLSSRSLELVSWPRRDALASIGDLNGDGLFELATAQAATVWLTTTAPVPAAYCSAKLNSLSCEPAISSSGAASLVVGDNFVVSASNVLNAKPGVLLWSASPLAAPFAGGTLCVAPQPPSIRGPLLDSGGSPASASDCSGAYAYHFSHALMQSRGLTAGTALYAQFLSRDLGFAAPRNIGLSDALRFFVLP